MAGRRLVCIDICQQAQVNLKEVQDDKIRKTRAVTERNTWTRMLISLTRPQKKEGRGL